MLATVTLTGRKSLTIYHEGVEERFRQNIPRTLRKESLILYIKHMQQGMFAIEIVEEPKAEPAKVATKEAPPAPQEGDDVEGGDGDGDDDADKPVSPAKKPKKRAKVHTE